MRRVKFGGALMLILASVNAGGCDDESDERPAAGGSASGTAGSTAGSTAAASGRGNASGTGGSSSGGDAGHSVEDAGQSTGGNGDAGVGQGGRSMGTAGTSHGGAPEGGEANEAGAAGVGGDEPSGVRDIEHTALEVDLDTYQATATIRLGPAQTPGASFEMGDLYILSVELDGAALKYTQSDGLLTVDVPAGSEPLTISVNYYFSDHPGLNGYSSIGYTFTWPYFCGNLFPCRSEPANGTTFGLEVTGGSGTLVYPTEIPYEAPSYMAAWAHGNYEELVLGTTGAGTQVSAYYLTDVANAESDAALGTAYLVEGFDWYEEHFGPYPFGPKVAPVAIEWGAAGGMEHHPFWHISTLSMSDPVVHLHEASHGWFGNGVRLRCWEDFMLSEGIATYLSGHVLEELGETEFANEVWINLAGNAAASNVIPWPDGCGNIDILTSGLFSDAVYAQGALFFRSLEQRIGAAALENALRDFYVAWKGKAAGIQDLLDTVEESSGYDAGPCAEAWLKSTPAPTPGPCE